MGRHIAVIGSGFGGLGLAIRLQASGYEVTIYEKRARVGGRAYQMQKEGYTFDMGPSLITAPFLLTELFRLAGKTLSDAVDLIPLDPFYRIYFHDGSRLDYSGNRRRMKEEMARFNRADAERYDDFFRAIGPIYDAVIREGLGATPFLTLKSMAKFIPRALSLGGFRSVTSFVNRFFTDERHRFAFSFHPLFIGGSPFRSPSIYAMIPALERNAGVWFAKGGMYAVVRALEQLLLDLGGTVKTGAAVEEIVVTDGRATGVIVDGEFHAADAVASNGDVPWVYKHLIRPEHRRRWTDRSIDRLHISMSCFVLYLGARKQYPRLLHHTLILSERYRELVRDIFDRKILPDDLSMYLHVPTRTDPAMAPPGCESMYVLAPVPHLGSGIEWSRKKDEYRDRILRFLEEDFGLEDLRASLDVVETFTPEDFRDQLSSHLGSAFSIEPRLTQSAYFRPHNRSEDIGRLYFAGAGTHPGAGMPGVLLSAAAAESCIIEDLGPGVPRRSQEEPLDRHEPSLSIAE